MSGKSAAIAGARGHEGGESLFADSPSSSCPTPMSSSYYKNVQNQATATMPRGRQQCCYQRTYQCRTANP